MPVLGVNGVPPRNNTEASDAGSESLCPKPQAMRAQPRLLAGLGARKAGGSQQFPPQKILIGWMTRRAPQKKTMAPIVSAMSNLQEERFIGRLGNLQNLYLSHSQKTFEADRGPAILVDKILVTTDFLSDTQMILQQEQV